MSIFLDKQVSIDVSSREGCYNFSYQGDLHQVGSRQEIYRYFQEKGFDTIKLCYEKNKAYLHYLDRDVELYNSKEELRSALCKESGGAWVEEESGKKRYYLENHSFFGSWRKEVSEAEFKNREKTFSVSQKVLGIGLCLFGVFNKGAISSKIGTREVGAGLIGFQNGNPMMGLLSYSLMSPVVQAQAMGYEFQVNTWELDDQSFPSSAPLPGGGFGIFWDSMDQDGDGVGVFGQFYNFTGEKVGGEFQVADSYVGSQSRSEAVRAGNTVKVVWQESDQSGTGIFGKSFSGSPLDGGSAYQLNVDHIGYQWHSSLASIGRGGTVVTWESTSGGSDEIIAKKWSSNTEFQVNTQYTINDQTMPAIARIGNETFLENNEFVIVWLSDGQDGQGTGVFGQRFDQASQPVGTNFQVNDDPASSDYEPSATHLSSGGFVVTWYHSLSILGQIFNNVASPIGANFQVNSGSVSQLGYPKVASLQNGRFVVVWQNSDSDGSGIAAQLFDDTGTRIGSEIQVNCYESSDQGKPTVSPLDDGGFVVAWESEWQDGNYNGIFGQRFDEDGNHIPLNLNDIGLSRCSSADESTSSTSTDENSDRNVGSSLSIQPMILALSTSI